jgi:uncharacterized membrane protein YfcA
MGRFEGRFPVACLAHDWGGMRFALVALVLFGSTLIRSLFGFGDALLAMPLMSLVVGVGTATPVMGLASLVIAVGILLTSWRHVDVSAVRRLLTASLIGIPVGVLMLKGIDERVLRIGLGVIVAGFGLYRLTGPRLPELHTPSWAYLFGFVGGCLGGAYNVGGPPLVVYGAMRRWDPQRFRGTLQATMLGTSVLIATAHGVAGLWTEDVWRLFLVSIPALVLAMLIGGNMAKRIRPKAFDRYLSLALVILGLMLLIG